MVVVVDGGGGGGKWWVVVVALTCDRRSHIRPVGVLLVWCFWNWLGVRDSHFGFWFREEGRTLKLVEALQRQLSLVLQANRRASRLA